MNKKTLFAYIVLIGCIILLVGSYMQWKSKISSVKVQSPTLISSPSPSEKNDKSISDEEIVESEKPKQDVERLLTLTANADEQVQIVFADRLESDDRLDFLIVGSTVMEAGEPGYAESLKTALKDAYGEFINVTIKSIDETSDVFVENLNNNIDLSKGYDVVLFEPFTLNNNGVIIAEDQHEYIQMFNNRLIDEVEDAVLVLHPSQPLHKAIYYPNEVKSVQTYAESNDIPFVDHWTDWPAIDSDELPRFLDKHSLPNNAGAEIWANALINYFIAK